MKDENKNLYYLHELTDYKVADDYADVRDWQVVDADDKIIGKVDGLLVSKEAERVVYLDVEVDRNLIEAGHKTYAKPTKEGVHEFLNKDGENHLIIPIGLTILDENLFRVQCNEIDYTTFSKTKRFKKGDDIQRSYELLVLPHYSNANATDEVNEYDEPSFYGRKEFTNSARSKR
jgi:hypothetical protein